MTDAGECARFRPSLGALATASLDPAEAAATRAHLDVCASCAAEAASLATVAGFLARVTARDALALPAGDPAIPGSPGSPGSPSSPDSSAYRALPEVPHLLPRILAEGRRRSRRQRRRRLRARAAAAVAVAALVVGVAGLALWNGTRDSGLPPEDPVLVSARNDATGVWTRLELRPRAWGTSIAISLGGVPGGNTCELVAVGPGEVREVAATWSVPESGYDDYGNGSGGDGPGGSDAPAGSGVTLSGGVGQPIGSISRFEIVSESGRVLLGIPAPR